MCAWLPKATNDQLDGEMKMEEFAPCSMTLPTLEVMPRVEHLEAEGHEDTQTLELKEF